MSNNLNVFADATINGGTYNEIKVFGSADVTGDLTVENMNIFGSADFHGKCKINSLKVFGSCDFKDFVEVNELNIKGSCDFDSDVKVDFLKVYGSVEFSKDLFRSKEVNIFGEVKVNRLEADEIMIKGFITCKEQLNGDKIEISTNQGSKIKEMVGTQIIVKPNRKFLSFPKDIHPIEVETIEGDDIYLENVNAKVVRGNKIKIGPNCQIELVEYHNEYSASNDSKISKVEKY